MAERRIRQALWRVLRRIFRTLLRFTLGVAVFVNALCWQQFPAMWWLWHGQRAAQTGGNYSLAVSYFEKALKSCQAIIIPPFALLCEAPVLASLGQAHGTISHFEQAINIADKALAIYRELEDREGEGAMLALLGMSYTGLSQHEKAIDNLEQALVIQREVKARELEVGTLVGLSQAHLMLSQYGKAVAYSEQALAIAREMNNRAQEGLVLFSFCGAYIGLRQPEKMIEYCQQASTLLQESKDWQRQVAALLSLGGLYEFQQQPEKAIAFYEQALKIQREMGDHGGEGLTLSMLGNVFLGLQQPEKVIGYYERALVILREGGLRTQEGMLLANLGAAYFLLGQPEKMIEYYAQALVIQREVRSWEGEGVTLHGLMMVARLQKRPQLAIFYGKQVVNIYQAIRGEIRSLDKELQQSFLKSKEDTYRTLADLLITESRMAEAEQVLQMLKEEEFFDFVRRERQTASQLLSTIGYSRHEDQVMHRYQTLGEEIARTGKERKGLLEKQQRTEEEERRLTTLEPEFSTASQTFTNFLHTLPAVFDSTPQNNKLVLVQNTADDLQQTVTQLGPGTVALWTLVGEERSWLVLVTAKTRKAYPIAMTRVDLEQKITEFRTVLRTPRTNPIPLAQELYRLLVSPVARDLERLQVRTLLWSLDGQLRYVPLAALHDGQRYVIERYGIGVFTLAGHQLLRTAPHAAWTAAGLGVSKAHEGFLPLAKVPEELRGIIRDENNQSSGGILPGTIRLDEQFTEPVFQEVLTQQYPVVHVASHFHLQPGNETQSFLLLGDGSRLGVDQLKNYPFSGVDLLTLSACKTGVGITTETPNVSSGREVESFAMLVQYKGAKAVLASLWALDDVSTTDLMHTFYRVRQTKGTSKVEALRQAQLTLLRGNTGSISPKKMRGAVAVPPPSGKNSGAVERIKSVLTSESQAPYAHPYYWAPFILIGNGL